MAHNRKRIVSWVVAGGAFLVVAAAAGCGRVSAEISWNKPQPAVAAPQPPAEAQANAPAAALPDDALKAVPVNIFGEFEGANTRFATEPAGPVNLQQHTFVTEGYDADVAIDPTGKWMAFSSTRHNVHPEIYLQRTDGHSVIQLTNDQADNVNPAFSHDGKRIAFASNRAGSWDIYVMDTDGRNLVQMTSGPMQDLQPTWSPDGSMICFARMGGRSDQWELWIVDTRTLETRMIGHGLFPSWSPDKTHNRIAFQRARQRGSRWFSLWTLDLVDGEARQLTEIAVSTNAAIVKPSWSPDGKGLAFCTIVEPAKTTRGKPSGQQDVWIIKADGTGRRRLTDGNGSNLMPAWSVDNRVYFISDRSGKECIWSVRVDEPTPSQIAATE